MVQRKDEGTRETTLHELDDSGRVCFIGTHPPMAGLESSDRAGCSTAALGL